MTLQKITQTVFIAVIALVIYGCNSSATSPTKDEPVKKRLTMFQENWIRLRSISNKLVFKLYYFKPDSGILGDLNSETWADSTTDSKKIADFNRLFKDTINSGYSCCPFYHFSVTFFRDTTELGNYFVDTLEKKGKAMFFDGSYQTWCYIDMKEWNTFLRTLTKSDISTATTR